MAKNSGAGASAGGNAVYGLGLIGALVWYWQQADGFLPHVWGILKAGLAGLRGLRRLGHLS